MLRSPATTCSSHLSRTARSRDLDRSARGRRRVPRHVHVVHPVRSREGGIGLDDDRIAFYAIAQIDLFRQAVEDRGQGFVHRVQRDESVDAWMDVDVLFRIPRQSEQQFPDRDFVHDHAVGGGLGCRLGGWQEITGGADGGGASPAGESTRLLVRWASDCGMTGWYAQLESNMETPSMVAAAIPLTAYRPRQAKFGELVMRCRGQNGSGRFPKMSAIAIAEAGKARMVPDAPNPIWPGFIVAAAPRAEYPTPSARKAGRCELLPAV